MEGLYKFLFDPRVREAVTSVLTILAEALRDGLEEGEAVQALNDIAKVVIDLLLPDADAQVEVSIK